MQTVGNYNNISEELRKDIPKLEGTAVFQMLNGVPNQEDDQKKEMPFVFGKTQLATQYQIKDPHSGQVVDIVLAEGWTKDRQPEKARCYVVGYGETHFRGSFMLREGVVDDEALWPILWLSPQREDSPCKDPKVQPLFKLLNQKDDNKKSTDRWANLDKAIGVMKKMKEEQGRKIAAALNWPEYKGEWSTIEAKLKDFARTNVDEFLAAAEDEKLDSKATLKNALDAGILVHDPVSNEVKLGSSVLTTLEKTPTFNLISSLQQWFDTAPNGKQVLEGIEKKLKKEKAPAAEPVA